MSSIENIDKNKVPQHIAIIMDGNGRWAKQRGKPRIFGHHSALSAVRESVEACAEVGVKYLTLYAFSTENWNRPKFEVTALMELLVSAISKEIKSLHKNNIRLTTIGDFGSLPELCQRELNNAMEKTKDNTQLTLVLALSYSAKWEILRAVNSIADKAVKGEIKAGEVKEEDLREYLVTNHLPDPELMIRTSGEHRISNFLLWQLAYAELYFTNKFWPDFRREDLFAAIRDYQQRERRFGLTGEQLKVK